MPTPRLVRAGVTLREQVNVRWPNRDKASDGWIGDAAHQARPSDHNPDADGWVHALDIDKDGIDADRLAAELIAYARNLEPGSRRLKYVVYKGRIASGTYPDKFWTWRAGDWGHYQHIHVSFTAAAELDGRPFALPVLAPPPIGLPVVKWNDLKNGSPTQNRLVQEALNRLPGDRYSASVTGRFADTKGPLLRYRIATGSLTARAALEKLSAATGRKFRVG